MGEHEVRTFEDAPFIRACRGRSVVRVPVWFMRQAGRSLPEYRAARGSGSILDAIARPELVAELTRQPVDRYGTDAAIFFSDIVVPVAAVGFGVDVTPGTGPVVSEPFRRKEDLDRLRPLEPEIDTPYVPEAIRILTEQLTVPLIGFAGGPFTVASYLVEGGPSKDFAMVKSLMHTEPVLWHELMERLCDMALASLRSQLDAGASAVQLFDSWAGNLTPRHYEELVLPTTRRLFSELARTHPDVPTILFGVGTGELLGLMATSGASVIGVDWRVPLDEARRRVGPGLALQGNLDPGLCCSTRAVAEAGTRDVLARAGTRPGFVFNLGHGVLPRTDPAILERVVELVHAEGQAGRGRPGVSAPGGGRVGVLVMAHGTPATRAGIEPFYTSIRRGSPPPPELLADLVRRYDAIGGTSPLAELTRSQVEGVAAVLEAEAPGRYRVAFGAKHTQPTIEAGVAELAAGGADRIVAVVLAPQESSLGSGQYLARAVEAARAAGPGGKPLPVTTVPSWGERPALAGLLAERTREALARVHPAASTETAVFFTAHSLPTRVVETGDPYPGQVAALAGAVAGRLGLDGPDPVRWGVAYQSAGRTPDPWLGPELLAELRRVAADGVTEVVVCPVGFVADHLEILYDLDIEARQVAASVGMELSRTRSLNDDPGFLRLLAAVVMDADRRGGSGGPDRAASATA